MTCYYGAMIKNTYIFGIVLVVIALVLFGVTVLVPRPSPIAVTPQLPISSTGTPSQICTQEAKQCPDGSYVARTGPQCAFAECPAVVTQERGTLQGTMSIGPICPVEQIDHPCKPTPEMYAAHKVFVYNANKSKLITTLTPDAQGKFSTSLFVGTYLVDVEHQAVGSTRGVPITISISKGKTSTVSIDIDTGIR